MKKRIYLLGIILMLSGVTNMQAAYVVNRPKDHEQTKETIVNMQNRIEEIKAMDLKELSRVDRRDLKHELRDMRRQLHSDPVVIVISGLGLLLIILLLILLL